MRILHISDGWELANGAANIARLIGEEQRAAGHSVSYRRWVSVRELRAVDEVWVHCGWKPCLWWATLWARRCRWMPEGCYDPLRLGYHGWKKVLAGPVERWCLRRVDAAVAACAAEADWIRAYEPRMRAVEILDVKRFFSLPNAAFGLPVAGRALHLLFLGRHHPLKGLNFLEEAVARINRGLLGRHTGAPLELRAVSNAFGEEKEKVLAWCDVLVLPTLSENFGLVVAEALERGKRVITTDGAPAWENQPGVVYLKGYRAGTDAERVRLLVQALEQI